MRRELLAICGPFSINSYGVAIVIGILLFMWLIKKHPKAGSLHLNDTITDILLVSICAGIIGGRLWYVLSEPKTGLTSHTIFSVWDGGFSLLGAILGIAPALAFFFKKNHMPILPCLDIIALHAPLLQSISRIGCFFAGCCYGYPTTSRWGFMYTDPYSMAPLYTVLHPTQLYSAMALLSIFFLLYGVLQKVTTKPGQLLTLYLILISAERFLLDFWRADRITHTGAPLLIHGILYTTQNGPFSLLALLPMSLLPTSITTTIKTVIAAISVQQTMAFTIFIGAAISLIYISTRKS